MNENPMTFEELVNYVQQAKDRAEEKRSKWLTKKQQECMKLVQKISDKLEEKEGGCVELTSMTSRSFNLDGAEETVQTDIFISDMEKLINEVPALNYANATTSSEAKLSIWFSETNV